MFNRLPKAIRMLSSCSVVGFKSQLDSMAYQVSKIVQICTCKLRLVNIIRDKLSVHVAERVVNAMVTGNLNYCNSPLHNITAGQLGRGTKATKHSSQTHTKENPS